jgi:hypothetical protein
MQELLDFTAQHFNAIRLPFSAELALNLDARQPGNIDYGANPELQGLTTGQVMDRCAGLNHWPWQEPKECADTKNWTLRLPGSKFHTAGIHGTPCWRDDMQLRGTKVVCCLQVCAGVCPQGSACHAGHAPPGSSQ